MRKTIDWMVANLDLPKTFDELRADTRVGVAAVALDKTEAEMAFRIEAALRNK